MRVAVVGGSLSGLAAAHELASSGGGVRVTVYEKEGRLGGRGNKAVAVDDGAGGRVLVDLGCMAFNTVRPCIRYALLYRDILKKMQTADLICCSLPSSRMHTTFSCLLTSL